VLTITTFGVYHKYAALNYDDDDDDVDNDDNSKDKTSISVYLSKYRNTCDRVSMVACVI
jgi:Na+/H+ antiporter NhaB